MKATILMSLMFLALPACAGLPQSGEPAVDWDRTGDPSTFTLEVENQNFNGARIYIHQDGRRHRLGLVNGNRTEEFEVTAPGGSEIRVEVDFIAGGGFTTGPLVVWPGESVRLRIPSRA